MKVVFWSNVRGQCGTTLHVTCMAAIQAYFFRQKVVLMENHDHIVNIDTCLSGRQGDVFKEETIHNRYGLESMVDKLIKASPDEGKRIIERYAIFYGNKRLCYLPHGYLSNMDLLDYRFVKNMDKLFNSLELHFDTVYIDTFSMNNLSTKAFIESADFIVVNLNQNDSVLSHFFRNYSSFRKKSIYFLGNYYTGRYNSISDIRKRYHIPENRIFAIPYCMEAAQSEARGCIANFIMENYKKPSEGNMDFFTALRKAYNGMMSFYSASSDSSGSRGLSLI